MSNQNNNLMKKSKKFTSKLVLCYFIVSIILFSAVRINEINMKPIDNKRDYPNLSADEITINTPENITYTKPMSGYYPATYGFENDEIGDDPYGWIDGSGSGCTAQVISGIGGHNKVIELYDNHVGNVAEVIRNFSPAQTYGSIELWWRTPDVSIGHNSYVSFYNGATWMGYLKIETGKWKYAESGIGDLDVPNVNDPQDNNWHHIKIHFECTTGGYQGLGQYQYEFIIDSISSGALAFWDNQSQMSLVRLSTNDVHSGGYYAYYDAVGFSWDPNYNIGDNLNEGFLLSYDTAFTPDWMGYSLDDQANRTILGNTTFSFPTSDGFHSIQVFGNNTFGTMYKSDIRYFTTKLINIFTPENITYTSPMEGYFPATYGFENEEVGTSGTDINFVDYCSSSSNCYIDIIPDESGHKKVLRGYDGTASGMNDVRHYFDDQTSGTVEFYIRLSSTDDNSGTSIYFGGGGIAGPAFGLIRGYFTREENSGWQNIKAFSANTWYHIRMDFECGNLQYEGLSADTYYLYIDGIKYGSYNFRFNDDAATLDMVMLYVGMYDGNGYYYYIDAWGESWNPDYTIGDNLNEGFLLSYDIGFVADWMGYSLDSQTNRTILGNTTILMPLPGHHTIQVFGNNSIGEMFKSDVRHFSVRAIDITTPENITYTKPMSGYYPATYSFENDVDGTSGTDINFVDYCSSSSNCYIDIIPDESGHKKVLRGYDGTASGMNDVRHYFDDQTSGTVEFYIRLSSTDDNSGTSIYFGGGGIAGPAFGLIRGYFTREENSGWQNIKAFSANTWYHIRMDFECGNLQYEGLSADTYYLYIDGIKYGSYNFRFNDDAATLDMVMLYVGMYDGNGYYYYIDAWGESWNPDYTIGDNLNEGFLLSYDIGFVADWMGYSLDSQTNRTILGNTTIPMTADGIHYIQVFSNNSLGKMYESDVRYFIVDTSAPIISGIDNIIEVKQNSNYPLDWEISDISGGTYVILKNGSDESAGLFQSEDVISIIVDTTELGYLNYTLIATDLSDHTSSHTVIVKIIPQEEKPPIPGFNVVFLFFIVLITIGIIVKVKFKIQK
ncbi:MAG: hypothetical protein ACFFA0_11510 [Promethearchaeota archaeon]